VYEKKTRSKEEKGLQRDTEMSMDLIDYRRRLVNHLDKYTRWTFSEKGKIFLKKQSVLIKVRKAASKKNKGLSVMIVNNDILFGRMRKVL
jgi:hypothetical protein